MTSGKSLAAGTAMGRELKKAWTATVTLVLFAAGIITSTVSGQDSCGVVGTNQNEQTVRRDEAFYLNTQNPATCDGNITSFRYCNYEPESSFFASLVTYSSIFAIYRPLDNGTYTTVSQTFTVGGSVNAINLGNYDSEDRRWPNSFGCGQLDLDTPVTVQVGDVIGACVFNSPVFGVVELDLVGATGNSNDRLLSTDVAGCAHEAVPSSVTTLTESDSLVLHIDADIVPLPTVAPTEATTEAMTTMGTEPSTSEPTTSEPTTSEPTTSEPITSEPTTSEPTTTMDTEPTTSEPTTTMDTEPTTSEPTTSEPTTSEPTTSEPVTTPTEPPVNSNSVAVEPSMVAPSPSSTEVVPATSILNEVNPSSTNTINQPRTSEAVVVQPTPTSIVLPLTSSAPNLITTEEMTTEQSTTSGPIGVVDDPTGIITIIVPVVLIVLLVGAVFAVVMIFIVKRKRKIVRRAFNIQNPHTGSPGVVNAVYSYYDGKEGVELYDDIQAKNIDSMEHTYDYASASDELNHTYEEGFMSVVNNGAVYDSAYSEVGPFEEFQTDEHYSSPLDSNTVRFSTLLEKNKQEDIYDQLRPFQVPASAETEVYSQLKSWGTKSIPRNEIKVKGHLGSGQFGSVEQGLWKRHGTTPVDVALKSLNKESSEEDKLKFLQEAAIMAQFRHSNVILLHGVVAQGEPILIVVELASKGDLQKLLLSLKPDPGELLPGNIPHVFLKFSQQVALGMQYLSAKGFVHRDLAARNVLVSNEGICKIADFGMSRDLADENYYISQGGKVPIKWTAPEAIHYKKYSTASDVWAYGCLLYEIWSVGFKPFEGVTNINVIRLVDSGKRLFPPPACPRVIYELMILCWHPETSLRPSFRDIVLTLVGSEQMVLNIPEKDLSTNPLAGVLGAPLEAGQNMYTNLQKRYIDYTLRAERETDEDYFEVN